MQKNLAVNIFSNDILEVPGNSENSLLYIVDRYMDGDYEIPPHQRGKVWDKNKVKDWINRIKISSKNPPIGTLVTYQIKDSGNCQKYINDGYQRIVATVNYIDNPEEYGDTADIAKQYLSSCKITVQHRHYINNEDALKDFQNINKGTALDAYEYCKGVLTYMPDYETKWNGIINSLHDIVPNNETRICNIARKPKSRSAHRDMRHDYALFVRCANNVKTRTSYRIPKTLPSTQQIENKKVIEWTIRETLLNIGISGSEIALEKLSRIVRDETALLETIMQKQDIKVISQSLYRSILDIAIWRRNNNISAQVWIDFVDKLLYFSMGRSQVRRIDPESGKIIKDKTTMIGDLSWLLGVCKIIDSNILDVADEKRSKKATKSGYDNSHYLPFSEYGDGETFQEPSIINRSRGAKPV